MSKDINPSNSNGDVELTYGIDHAAPNGDETALTIKDGETIYSYVAAEAEVLIRLIQTERTQAAAEAHLQLASQITTDKGDAYYQNIPLWRYKEQLKGYLSNPEQPKEEPNTHD